MAESLGSAVLDLSVDTSELESGLGDAEQTTDSRMGRIAGVIGKGAAAAGAGLLAAGGAAIGAAFKTAAYGDEVAKTSTKMGVSTDALQEMRYWADRNGISASSLDRAVGRLNQRVGRAATGNDKYAKAFEDLGVSIHDSEGNIRDTNDVMGDTVQRLSEIEDPALQSAMASEIFGTKMARDLMPALQDGALSMEEAAEMAHDLGVVMDEDATKSAEQFTDAWADIKDTAGGFLRDFGTPVMAWMSESLFPVIQDKVIPALQEFAGWLGPKLQAGAEVVFAFFQNHVLPAFERLSAWWEENGPAIIGHAEALWDGIQTALDGIAAAFEWVVGLFQRGEGETSETMQKLKDTFAVVWEAITLVVTRAAEDVMATIEWLTDLAERIWDRWGEDLMRHAERAWEAIQRIIGGVLDVIRGIFDVFIGIFTGDWQRAWDGVKTIFSGIWNVIAGLWDGILSGFQTALTIAMDLLKDLWSNTWEWVRGKAVEWFAKIALSVKSGIDDVVAWVQGLPDQVQGLVSDAGTWLLEAGKNIIRGLIDGITSMFSNLRSTMSDAASTVRNMLPFSPAKEGPLSGSGSPDLAGAKIAEMLASGLDDGTGDISTAMSRLVDFDVDVHGTAGRSAGIGDLRVFIGEREITDIVGTEIDGKFSPLRPAGRSA